jgi:radical SAM superfamily enzyme
MASYEEKWGGCAFCNMADKGLTMTERRKPLKLRVRRQIIRRISQESWTDQLVLRAYPNRLEKWL